MQLRHEPAGLVLSRGALPTFDRERYASAAGLARGASVLADAVGGPPEVLLMGTGSELAPCVAAYEQRSRARRIATACSRRASPRVAVEAASGVGWAQYSGSDGAILAMQSFGASAPRQQLLQKYGFTAEHVAAVAKEQAKEHIAGARRAPAGRMICCQCTTPPEIGRRALHRAAWGKARGSFCSAAR